VVKIHRDDGFLPHDAMLTRYMLQCRSHVSVESLCSTETAKHRITQTTPHDSPFSEAEDLGKAQTGSPLTEAQMQVG